MRQLALEAKIRPACLCTFQRPTEGRCRQGFCRRYRYWRGPELSAARHSQVSCFCVLLSRKQVQVLLCYLYEVTWHAGWLRTECS